MALYLRFSPFFPFSPARAPLHSHLFRANPLPPSRPGGIPPVVHPGAGGGCWTTGHLLDSLPVNFNTPNRYGSRFSICVASPPRRRSRRLGGFALQYGGPRRAPRICESPRVAGNRQLGTLRTGTRSAHDDDRFPGEQCAGQTGGPRAQPARQRRAHGGGRRLRDGLARSEPAAAGARV